MKKYLPAFLSLCAICISACHKNQNPPAPAPKLTVTAIVPAHAAGGATITISGSGFSTTTSANVVTINDKAATVVNASANSLSVMVPQTAGTGAVKIAVNNNTVTGPVLTYDYVAYVTTLAASATAGPLFGPDGICVDGQGYLYVTDNNAVRKITPQGVVTTLAGSSTAGYNDGMGTSAHFNGPEGITVDLQGNVYVADYENSMIRKITPAGLVKAIVGGGPFNTTGTESWVFFPHAVCAAPGNLLYMTDQVNAIRKITSGLVVSFFAGSGDGGYADGTGSAAVFNEPYAICSGPDGSIYVADTGNEAIRVISPAGVVSTLAGSWPAGNINGPGTAAKFNKPLGLCFYQGNVYVADTYNHLIRKIDVNGNVTTFAGTGTAGGTDGIASASQFSFPASICVDANGNFYVTDGKGVRKIILK